MVLGIWESCIGIPLAKPTRIGQLLGPVEWMAHHRLDDSVIAQNVLAMVCGQPALAEMKAQITTHWELQERGNNK